MSGCAARLPQRSRSNWNSRLAKSGSLAVPNCGEVSPSAVKPTVAESGVKLFLPFRSPTDPTAFFIFELYQNEAEWAEHQRTVHFKSFIDNMLPRIARRERVPCVPYVPND
jgi:quinol monooxygenase YgiN